MRKIDEIIVHCTATTPKWWFGKSAVAKVSEVRRWHKAKGWSDIGYHYLIDRDGTVVIGRPIERTGAHVKGHNTGSIGVALFGGHGSSASDSFEDNYTEDQNRSLRTLIAELQAEYGCYKLTGHNQYAAKACPGFNVPRWIAVKPVADVDPLVLEAQRTSPTQSRTAQASVAQVASAVGGGAAAVASLEGAAQIVAIGGCVVIAALGVFILRERLRHWANGVR